MSTGNYRLILAVFIQFLAVFRTATSQFYAGLDSGDIIVWNISTSTYKIFNLQHTDRVNCLKLLNNGNLASGSNDGNIIIWDTTKGTPLSEVNEGSAITALEQMPNGYLISGSYDGLITVWNSSNLANNLITVLNAPIGSFIRCLKALNSTHFAGGLSYYNHSNFSSEQDFLLIWDMRTFNRVESLYGHVNDVLVLELLSDGLLASGSADFTVRIWNTSDGRMIKDFQPLNNTNKTNQVACMKQVYNQPILAVGGNDNSVYFWQNQTNQTNDTSFIGSIVPPSANSAFCNSMQLNGNLLVMANQIQLEVVNLTDKSFVTYSNSVFDGYQIACLENSANITIPNTNNTYLRKRNNTSTSTSTTATTIATVVSTADSSSGSNSGSGTSGSSGSSSGDTSTTNSITTISTSSTNTTSTVSTATSTISTATTTLSTSTFTTTTTTTTVTSQSTSTAKLTTALSTSSLVTSQTAITTTTTNYSTTFNPLTYPQLFTSDFVLSTLSLTTYTAILNSTYDVSDCIVNCTNNGICKYSGNLTFVCVCNSNYAGQTCQVNTLPCSHNPCLNNATCYENTTSYYCACSGPLYYGTNCELRRNLCENETCSGNGKCEETNNNQTAVCKCFSQYSGSKCEIKSKQLKDVQTVVSTSSIIAIVILALFYTSFLISDIFDYWFIDKSDRKLKKKAKHEKALVYKP